MASVITDVGQQLPAAAMVGSVTKFVGWGTGAGTSGPSDTALFSEKALDLSASSGTRATGSQAQGTTSVTNDTYIVTATLTATGPGTVTNVGLWDNATIGSGKLYLKGDFAGEPLGSGDAIAFTFKVRFS